MKVRRVTLEVEMPWMVSAELALECSRAGWVEMLPRLAHQT